MVGWQLFRSIHGTQIACVTAQTEAPGGRTEAREASTLFTSNDHEVLEVKNVFELNFKIEVNFMKNGFEICINRTEKTKL